VEALEGIILDISDRKEMENNLRYMNEHDSWTGLYNRRYLEKVLNNDLKGPFTEKRALVSVPLRQGFNKADCQSSYDTLFGQALIVQLL
jgi:GGDEF domain-containing protein